MTDIFFSLSVCLSLSLSIYKHPSSSRSALNDHDAILAGLWEAGGRARARERERLKPTCLLHNNTSIEHAKA